MNDTEFLDAFEGLTLPAAHWNHRAHVRLAYLYASRLTLAAATDRMRAGVQALNRTTGTPETLDRGYHETITQAFMRLVYAAYLHTRPHPTSVDFCDQHPELLDKLALGHYYSTERIKSWLSKTSFVPPDIQPLPIVVGDSISIAHVQGTEALHQVRNLFLEYARSLGHPLCFQRLDEELQGLPGDYACPAGRLFLAREGKAPIGCGALRLLSERICELKRLWVTSSHRCQGLGQTMVMSLIDEARHIGYSAIRLDTLPSMASAIRLYRRLGFREIAPYGTQPISHAMFFQLDL